MSLRILSQIRENLASRRLSLTDWLFNTPAAHRRLQLGNAAEAGVQEHLAGLEAAIAAAESGALGVCEICHGPVEEEVLQIDYTACVCIKHMSEDERRMLEFELEMAADLQRSLLPQRPPDFPELQVAAFSRPAQLLGGDYFDFFRFADSSYGLAIADVAGHGISASLHMAAMQTLLRAFAPLSATPEEVVAHLQRMLVHNVNFTTFITAFLAAYNPRTGLLTYTNAGHNPPLLLPADASLSAPSAYNLYPLSSNNASSNVYPLTSNWLLPTAPAVGLVEDAHFGTASVQLHSGDTLVLYTDGLTEATGPEMQEFGPARLAQVAWQARRLPVQELARRIRSEVEDFAGGAPLPDDVTLVVVRVAE